jgi:hypothetical protein
MSPFWPGLRRRTANNLETDGTADQLITELSSCLSFGLILGFGAGYSKPPSAAPTGNPLDGIVNLPPDWIICMNT